MVFQVELELAHLKANPDAARDAANPDAIRDATNPDAIRDATNAAPSTDATPSTNAAPSTNAGAAAVVTIPPVHSIYDFQSPTEFPLSLFCCGCSWTHVVLLQRLFPLQLQQYPWRCFES